MSQDDDAPTAVGTLGRAPTGQAPAVQPEPEVADRYELGGLLGRGGMGEVRFAHDVRIDREVAIKLMRPDQRDDDTIARFLREAQIQGRLDHPAVVPVHDLGVDRHGNPYFVMKRLAGTTLAEVIAQRNDPVMREKWPRRQLLARFVDVCLAVEFAHTRGIVHRDLKPANIMLGDFGEAYVLDWGLARVAGDLRRSQPIAPLPGDSGAGTTVAGSLLGTPGYMPPEQIRDPAVDARADVYALGCMLYEIVTGNPALPRGMEALDATLAARCHRPSERFVELAVPPELDDICAEATTADRAGRPSARAVADAIQAYLDGDRDLARRRDLAGGHAERAQEALSQPGDEARARAMREAGRALVLDPNNIEAQGVLATLLLEAPDTIPAEALAEADADRSGTRHAVLRKLWTGYIGLALLVGIIYAFPIRHIAPVIALQAVTASTGLLIWLASRRPLPIRAPLYLAALWLNALSLACGCLAFGPLLVVPIFLIASLAGAIGLPIGYRPAIVIVPHFAAIAAPLALEWLGVLPSTYHIEHGAFVLTPWAFELTPALAGTALVIAIVSQSLLTVALALTQRRAQDDAQNRLHAQTWHLRQLLPRRSTGQQQRQLPPR